MSSKSSHTVGYHQKEEIAAWFAHAAPTYDAVGPRFFSHFADRLVSWIEVSPRGEVLDVATGTGVVLLRVADRLAPEGRVVGVDLTQSMLDRAAEEIERRGLANARVELMDAESLTFDDASFDYLFCAYAIMMFPNVPEALAGFRRVLRPGSPLGLSGPSIWFSECEDASAWVRDVFKTFGVVDTARPTSAAGQIILSGLAELGFTDVEMRDEPLELVYRDSEEWWLSAWSHGFRRLFEAVAPERLGELKARLFAELEGRCEPDGTIRSTLTATLLRARSPEL